MASPGVKRRLAAILCADVVGYSRLMGADEAGTLAALKAHREQLIDPIIAAHNGRIVKLMGDGTLVEFASVVDAVQCAVEIQQDLAERNASTPADRQIQLRLGINVGDVIVEGGDIYGDGVNIAARLQELAEPGGVCATGEVIRQLRGKLGVPLNDDGERNVKNIATPVEVWRWAPATGDGQGEPAGGADVSPPLPEKPSIAVLPFSNMSGDQEQEYFSDGVTEDIITALSRVRWFFVIARNSAFAYKGVSPDVRQVARDLGVRYVLEGSMRKAANRVRVSAQLIDGLSGNHVWAKRYDHELEDTFAVQDEITETIVGEIEPELGKAERQRARSKKPENMDAWDVHQRGLFHLYRFTKVDTAEARRLVERAIKEAASLGAAYSGLAETYYYDAVYGFAASPEDCRALALSPARRGVELDDEDAAAHCTLGRTYLYLLIPDSHPAMRRR